MALPQDGQNANGLTKVTEIPKGKELIFIDPTTNEGGIITLEDLTTQILKNLTSQTFALDQGNMTLLAALNQLNSKALTGFKYIEEKDSHKSYEIDVSGYQSTQYHYGFLIYGWRDRIEILPFAFSVIPTDLFINLKDNSFVTAKLENNKITFTIDDTFWGGIRVFMLA